MILGLTRFPVDMYTSRSGYETSHFLCLRRVRGGLESSSKILPVVHFHDARCGSMTVAG